MRLPGAGVECQHCGEQLREQHYSPKRRFKTCPNCSGVNGSEHVYRKWPSEFGITDARRSDSNPDGAQSWCEVCRVTPEGNPAVYVTCSKVANVEISQGKPTPPQIRKAK